MNIKTFTQLLLVLIFINIVLLTASYIMDSSSLYTAAITLPLVTAGVLFGITLKDRKKNDISIGKIVKQLVFFIIGIGLTSYILVVIG